MDKIDSVSDQEAASKNPDLAEALMELRYARGLDIFGYEHPNKVSKWLSGDGYRYSSIIREQDVLLSLLKDGKRAEAELLVIDLLKGHYIDAYMEATRKNWAPGGHEGSQSQETDEYRLLIKAMTNVLDVEKAEWDAENIED
jgi:hypothetical protein